jgi:hypothetical protein
MAGKAVKGTNDADGDGKKDGSLPQRPDPQEEAEAARAQSEGPE